MKNNENKTVSSELNEAPNVTKSNGKFDVFMANIQNSGDKISDEYLSSIEYITSDDSIYGEDKAKTIRSMNNNRTAVIITFIVASAATFTIVYCRNSSVKKANLELAAEVVRLSTQEKKIRIITEGFEKIINKADPIGKMLKLIIK